MSGKFSTLQALSGRLPVPTLFALSDDRLDRLWSNRAEVQAEAAAALHHLHITAAAFLDRDLATLASTAPLLWRPDANAVLEELLSGAGLSVDTPVAVRSSGGIEDGASHSFAGIFESVLQVRGVAALRKAIEQVWRSSFSRRAVMERLRCGLLEAPLGMTVFVQRMIDPQWAGVAFSRDPVSGHPGMRIEAVPGLGELLVSGERRASTALLDPEHPSTVSGDAELLAQGPMLQDLRALVRAVETELSLPVDIEWAYDGHAVWLLQARPITTMSRHAVEPPTCEAVALYLAEDAALAAFQPLPGFAHYFRSKRRPLALLASQYEVAAGTALLVRANASGFANPAERSALLSSLATDADTRVVLDFSEGLRQQILPFSELATRLDELLSEVTTVFTVRQYIQGDFGLISQPTVATPGHARQVLCEISPDGLLAINRGSATTTSFSIHEHSLHGNPHGNPHGSLDGVPPVENQAMGEALDPPDPAALLRPDQQRILFEVSMDAVKRFGSVQLEWVLEGDRLRLIDFSEVAALHQTQQDQDQRTVSPGYAFGPTMRVEDGQALRDISIAATVSINHLPSAESLGPLMTQLLAQALAGNARPIVVSPRPYAALAALIPHVAGFVFEQSSLLCHLAILLREGQVPAVESAVLYQHAHSGRPITIRASSGQVHEVTA
ncbi:PEP-utilizing enzyme [Roseateles sp. SL47]|uniref:PEP/pyruvate-binding domain-containing protein n=1 Tax=Roseateles sp. SL47 TaxID=2995138 RepID=UPI00226E8269|nr:PEP/pyruvate-binding domain-containing protein [Roseateles sp. SL47]WAC71673.1 PEP-utilizing enzyme [Roseateles sp. SL47]